MFRLVIEKVSKEYNASIFTVEEASIGWYLSTRLDDVVSHKTAVLIFTVHRLFRFTISQILYKFQRILTFLLPDLWAVMMSDKTCEANGTLIRTEVRTEEWCLLGCYAVWRL
jgi:hypothetical protein